MSDTPTIFTVSHPDSGQRLDAYLARQLDVGRAQVKKLLAAGGVRVDGRRAGEKDKALFLSAGQAVEVSGPAGAKAQAVVPQPDLPLVVLSEGPGWLAVDKPAGMPVHPLLAGETQTLLNAVVARHPNVQGIGEGGLRSGVVHRLDVDTSGVVLFATEPHRWHQFRQAFQEHRTQKIYRAVVAGKLHGQEKLTLDLIIGQHAPAKVKVVDPKIVPKPAGTRRCHLTYKSVLSLRGATLIEVDLGTGFLHQIRVMLAHAGHPVLGDAVYGERFPGGYDIPRQLLHASHLKVGDVEAHSPEPEDFQQIVSELRGR